MTTTYTTMTDSDFWAEVRSLLSTASIGELDDIVTDEAESRDVRLARLRCKRLAIYRAATERAAATAPGPLDPGLTSDEQEQADQLNTAYRQRFTELVGA